VQIAYIVLGATSTFFLPLLLGVMMEQTSLLRYSAYKAPTVSPTLLGSNRCIFLLQIKNISHKHRRSAHLAFVRINHIPCLTEKIEHKFQKIC